MDVLLFFLSVFFAFFFSPSVRLGVLFLGFVFIYLYLSINFFFLLFHYFPLSSRLSPVFLFFIFVTHFSSSFFLFLFLFRILSAFPSLFFLSSPSTRYSSLLFPSIPFSSHLFASPFISILSLLLPPLPSFPQQQMHAQAGIPHGAHAPTLPMAPHPSLGAMPGLPPSTAAPAGLLNAVSSASLIGLPPHLGMSSVLGKPDPLRPDDKRDRLDDSRPSALLDDRVVSIPCSCTRRLRCDIYGRVLSDIFSDFLDLFQ